MINKARDIDLLICGIDRTEMEIGLRDSINMKKVEDMVAKNIGKVEIEEEMEIEREDTKREIMIKMASQDTGTEMAIEKERTGMVGEETKGREMANMNREEVIIKNKSFLTIILSFFSTVRNPKKRAKKRMVISKENRVI